jgi:hypothetical protein
VATTAFLLFPLAAWLAVALAAAEAPSQRDATAATLGGPARAALARLAAGVAVGLVGVSSIAVLRRWRLEKRPGAHLGGTARPRVED